MRSVCILATTCMLLSSGVRAQGATIEMVTVDNPENPGDTRYSTTMGAGSVDYIYDIGKYEVTAGQYAEFLDAVATTDTHGLYSTDMSDHWLYPSGIERNGTQDNYSYSVTAEWADRPVTFVSWGDAARFCNWLTNGQRTGSQDAGTTEDGSYTLNGATTDAELLAVTRNADAAYVIPTFDEWYKAAYYDANASMYYTYPTGTDAVPNNLIDDPDPGNSGNFYHNHQYVLGEPYWRTEVGEFENSGSPYGTFDQGGNVWEWSETTYWSDYRGTHGGSFKSSETEMRASSTSGNVPSAKIYDQGFRVAYVPEPGSIGLLILGSLAVIVRKR